MEPASIRFKNPGAMWGNALAKKWGSTQTVTLHDGLGQGNNIAVFPTYVQGISAQLDLWRTSPHYKNKRFADAIAIWSGHNHVESYIAYVLARVPGMTRDTVMNDSFWRGPMGVGFLKAQAGHEAGKPYPAEPGDWLEAQKKVFNKKPAIVKTVVGASATTATLWQVYGNEIERYLMFAFGIIVSIGLIYLAYHVIKANPTVFAKIWDYAKRAFGRSRTIFLQVFGMLSSVFVELSDQLTSLNLDDFFKHEVAVGITLVVSILTIFARLDTYGPPSFKALPEEPVGPAIPVVPAVEEVAQPPKAE